MTGSVAVKPPKTTYVFASRANELLLFLSPHRRVVHPDGSSEEVKGKTVQFEHGRVDVDDALAQRTGFESAEEMADAMRRSPHFQSDFMELLIDPPAPSPEDDIAEIMRLLEARDVDGLVELHAQELANFRRPTVLKAGQSALLALEGQDPHIATRGVELDAEPQEVHEGDPEQGGAVAGPEPGSGGVETDDEVDRSHLSTPPRAAGLFERTDG
jgi:hypothetical protein